MEPLRDQINAIDDQIIALLGERTVLSRLLGEYKHSNSLPVSDPAREYEIQARLRELAAKHGVDPGLCIKLYALIFHYSKSAQK